MDEELRILILGDLSGDMEPAQRELGKLDQPVVLSHVWEEGDYGRAIEEFAPQIILAEEETSSMEERDALAIAGRLRPESQVILMARSWRTKRALDALRRGAFDYITSEQMSRLGPSVQRAVREADVVKERKWAEAELFRREELFRTLIENSSDLFLVVDNQGKMQYISPSAGRILGYDPEELAGLLMFDFFHPEEKELALRTFWEVTASPGVTPSFSFRIINKKGAWRYLEGNASNLLENSIISGVVITARDVTERILQAKRLQKLNACLLNLGAHSYRNTRTVVESTREIMQSTIVQYCKKTREGVTFISTKPGEEEFSPVLLCSSLPCYRVLEEDFDGPLKIDDLRRTGFAAVYPDIIHFGLKTFLAFPVRLEGMTIGCINLFEKRYRDYTEEEMAMLAALAQTVAIEEERLRREEGMREFIDIASHELRHPITLISGYASLLREEESDFDAEKRKHILDVVFRCADRLDHLAGELLNVSRIEQNQTRMDVQATELEPLVRVAVEVARESYPDHRFRVSVAPEAALVNADAVELSRLLRELLDNACRYSPASSQVRVGAEAAGQEVLISVLDRGQGISEIHRERIFDRFYQAGDIMHHSGQGIGLGLYIAKEIADAHGGRLWYEPRPGGGSAFRVSLTRPPSGRTRKGTNRTLKTDFGMEGGRGEV